LGDAEQRAKALKSTKMDLHMVLEYNEGDTILQFKAPRSNRFYFVHDPNGGNFQQMETYHSIAAQRPDVKRHMVGGF
jgi:hypothetical protein